MYMLISGANRWLGWLLIYQLHVALWLNTFSYDRQCLQSFVLESNHQEVQSSKSNRLAADPLLSQRINRLVDLFPEEDYWILLEDPIGMLPLECYWNTDGINRQCHDPLDVILHALSIQMLKIATNKIWKLNIQNHTLGTSKLEAQRNPLLLFKLVNAIHIMPYRFSYKSLATEQLHKISKFNKFPKVFRSNQSISETERQALQTINKLFLKLFE